jgi:hypothetical protein
MIRKLAGIAGKLRRPRTLAVAAALALGTVAPVVAAATPAYALNCSYDAFYAFESDSTGGFAYNNGVWNGYGYKVVNAPGNFASFCQLNSGYCGGFYEWIQKGTANCLTVDATLDMTIDMKPCAGHPSQEWFLFGPNPNKAEDWAGVISGYPNGNANFLHDQGTGSSLTEGSQNGWQLVYTGR